MKFFDAVTEVRRRMGIIFLDESDFEWAMRQCVKKNKKVFDSLK
jgi:hypothetical protein